MDKNQIEESLKFVDDYLNDKPEKKSGFMNSKIYYWLGVAARAYLRYEKLKK